MENNNRLLMRKTYATGGVVIKTHISIELRDYFAYLLPTLPLAPQCSSLLALKGNLVDVFVSLVRRPENFIIDI